MEMIMPISLSAEKSFVILLSIVDLDGVATKKDVLDNIVKKQYISFSSDDLKMKDNRKELYWRNDLAFKRKGLVIRGYVDDSMYNQWRITDNGLEYLEKLCDIILNAENDRYKKLTKSAIQRAARLISENTIEYESLKQESDEDGMSLPNETQEALVRRIKRYKKIVNNLKAKYKGHCQIEGCNFTFKKQNGGYYAEAHHLLPLSKGGTQDVKNVVILCANHHRMFHYANVSIGDLRTDGKRPVIINDVSLNIFYQLDN